MSTIREPNGVAFSAAMPEQSALAPAPASEAKTSWLSRRSMNTSTEDSASDAGAADVPKRTALYIALAVAVIALLVYFLGPVVRTAFSTASIDDASVRSAEKLLQTQ